MKTFKTIALCNYKDIEKTDKDEEIENLAFENKMMAQALTDLGFTQDNIDNICSSGYNDVKEKTSKLFFIYQYDTWFTYESRVLFGVYINKTEEEVKAVMMNGFEKLYKGFQEDVYKNGENKWLTDKFDFGVSIEELDELNTFGEQ